MSGVVNIDTTTVAGQLALLGDGSNNNVEIRQAAIAGSYTITRPAGDNTLFQLNGAGLTFTTLTINGITGNISVSLGDGNDTFNFLGVNGGGVSNIPAHLSINNADGSNTNILNSVLVNGNLTVTKLGGSSGYSELQIINSTVIGDTVVNNDGGVGGDTKTIIENSVLQAGGAVNWGLSLTNGAGDDTTDIRGNSQFGTGSFVGLQPIVSITNGAGASRTTFTGASQTAGPGTTTVYGALEVNNGDNLPLALNIVTFNKTNVLGAVAVTNGDTTTMTSVTDSTLGSQLTAGGTGGPLSVSNDAGFDEFVMIGSTLPWGLDIDNDSAAGGVSTWGSATDIRTSSIGTRALGIPTPWAMRLSGDDGADVINLNATTIANGILDLLNVFDGNNSLAITNSSSVASLSYLGGSGNDSVTVDNSAILIAVSIRLASGADTLKLKNINAATQWPSPLLGAILIDGGIGVDTTNLDAITLGALGFEIFAP